MSPKSLLTSVAILAILATILYSEILVRPQAPDNKIHVSYWEKWTGFEGDAMQAVVDAYNKSQDRIHVDLLTVSGIENKVLMAAAGGTPPDVAGLYGPNLAQYADDNAIIPLDNYCRKYGISRDQYIPVYFDIGLYRGHIYSLPTTPASTALHYDKIMFRNAGLDPDKPPKTIEELDADAAQITTFGPMGKIDKSGFLPNEPGWWNWAWGYMFGGKLWDEADHLTANSPENVRAFNWVQSYSKHYGAGNIQTFKSGLGNFSSPQNGFLAEKVAMELQGVWMANFIDKYAPQLDKPKLEWGAVAWPYPADRPDLKDSTIADEDILVIPRGARHPDAAFEFIKYVESQPGMELLCLGQRKHSPLAKVSPGFYAHHPNPFIRLFYDLPKGSNVIVAPKLGIWREYSDTLSVAFDEIALEKKTAQQALDDVQARMQPKLKEYLERQRLRQRAGL